ncbi:MAG: hypothetical protein HGB22_05690 [Chlorobiaceae bacterium]|nr:hypothetical protein [Chlorobiaceae bacterium]
MDNSEAVARLFFYTHPVAHARKFMGQVMTVQISAGQLCPEMAGLIHEQ